MRSWLLCLFLLLVVLADRSFASPYFDDGEDADDLQDGDTSDYTDNALENLMRVAQNSSSSNWTWKCTLWGMHPAFKGLHINRSLLQLQLIGSFR